MKRVAFKKPYGEVMKFEGQNGRMKQSKPILAIYGKGKLKEELWSFLELLRKLLTSF